MMKFNQQSFTINASDMNLQSLKDISFIIGVGTTESINNELSFYYFKIQPQFKNVNIVRLTPGKVKNYVSVIIVLLIVTMLLIIIQTKSLII